MGSESSTPKRRPDLYSTHPRKGDRDNQADYMIRKGYSVRRYMRQVKFANVSITVYCVAGWKKENT